MPMTERELRRLSRLDLLQMLLSQSREVSRIGEENEELRSRLDELNAELERLNGKLDDRDAQIRRLNERLDDKDVLISMLRRGETFDAPEQRAEAADATPGLETIFRQAKEECRRYIYALLLEHADRFGKGDGGTVTDVTEDAGRDPEGSDET